MPLLPFQPQFSVIRIETLEGGNTVANCDLKNALIQVSSSDPGHNVVKNNIIISSPGNGISVSGGPDNLIQGNTIQQATAKGIYINAERSIVKENIINKSGNDGIFSTGSADSIYDSNIVTNSG